MKRILKSLSVLLAILTLIFCFVSCGEPDKPIQTENPGQNGEQVTELDYSSKVKLDMSSPTKKQEVTVKSFIDGDTTHFNVPTSIVDNGVLKARYLAINTPESTGKIEEYGKKASVFTKDKLSSAVSIIIESDDDKWNLDSTGGRYLVWVWYKTEEGGEYKNLNIEILQNGLAIASSSANNRYGTTCTAAIAQAKSLKYNVYSGEKDPDFYYGEAAEITLKELRCNLEKYDGIKVAFEGVITKNSNNSVYIEQYDSETDMYYGISVYYGYGLSGEGLNILSVGNLSRIVGLVQYYETGGTYQVSGLTYRAMKPKDPGNIQKISDGHLPAYTEIGALDFNEKKVDIEVDDEIRTFGYAELLMNTTVCMESLKVISAVTTTDEESSSYGAMTLTCESGGSTVKVRTAVLYDENGDIVLKDVFLGKIIDIKGIVDYYNGTYQIKVLTMYDIVIYK